MSEASDEPELLTDGFYDFREAAYGIAARQIWLLLGPKGAGKSAVLEHLRLSWSDRWDRFYTSWDLRSFPVIDVSKIQTGQSAGASRSQASWEFLLLLRVIESLFRDEDVQWAQAFGKLRDHLVRSGLLATDLKSKVIEWTKLTVAFKLPLLELGVEVASNDVGPLQLTSVFRQILERTEVRNQHLIALDGLDSFFFEAADEWNSLAGLIQALESVNRFLRTNRLPVTLVAAVRSDIFDLVPSAEKNKLKPHAAHLDWHAVGGIGAGNHLWRLVGKKVAVHRPTVKNIVSQYLSQPINIGPHTEMAEYFLDNTRLLPRDVIALLNYVKQCYRGNAKVSEAAAKTAVQRYCDEYFQGEIFDNLAGVLSRDRSHLMPVFRDALRSLPTRQFAFEDVLHETDGELERSEVRALLKRMFEVGGIGVRNYSGRVEHTDFAFRRVYGAAFTTQHGFLLHDALVRAWNRPWW